jgi:hypothetical protein
MSLDMINGLPAHVLFVHFVIVLVPLTALVLVVSTVWPSVAKRFGLLLPVLALVTLASVPVATQAGEWLERHVESDSLVRKHAELGDGLLPWALGLFVLAVAVWWVARSAEAKPKLTGLPVRVAVVALSVVVACGAVVDVYRIGDSGAKAAWHDGYSKTALHGGGDEG